MNSFLVAFRRYVLPTIMIILIVYTMFYIPISRSMTFLSNTSLKSSEQTKIEGESMNFQSTPNIKLTLEKLQALIDAEAKRMDRSSTPVPMTYQLTEAPTVATSLRTPENNYIRGQLVEEPKRGDEHIIFLETSCILGEKNTTMNRNKTGLVLKPRSACAIESAARTNPNRKVYVVYSCPIVGAIENSSEHVMQLFEYPNVKIWKLNVTEYFANTPLEKWEFYKKMNTSKWPLSHSSDVLRYLTLWKYGGTYLDMDFIIVRSLDDLGSNFVGAQSHNYIASGALNFRTEGVGQVVAHLCIRDLEKNFKGTVWGMNGPDVITRVLKSLCGKSEINQMTKEECLGFVVYPPEVFYKIPYWRHKAFFDANSSNITMKELDGSFGVHVWNKFTTSLNITVGSKQPYGLLAEKFCPRVYSNCGKVF
ncbi:hypothetical protein C0J52_07184 [Blattella germanica]|nr:hypothetical protein C0J52_07184 [Blattella germanica]